MLVVRSSSTNLHRLKGNRFFLFHLSMQPIKLSYNLTKENDIIGFSISSNIHQSIVIISLFRRIHFCRKTHDTLAFVSRIDPKTSEMYFNTRTRRYSYSEVCDRAEKRRGLFEILEMEECKTSVSRNCLICGTRVMLRGGMRRWLVLSVGAENGQFGFCFTIVESN